MDLRAVAADDVKDRLFKIDAGRHVHQRAPAPKRRVQGLELAAVGCDRARCQELAHELGPLPRRLAQPHHHDAVHLMGRLNAVGRAIQLSDGRVRVQSVESLPRRRRSRRPARCRRRNLVPAQPADVGAPPLLVPLSRLGCGGVDFPRLTSLRSQPVRLVVAGRDPLGVHRARAGREALNRHKRPQSLPAAGTRSDRRTALSTRVLGRPTSYDADIENRGRTAAPRKNEPFETAPVASARDYGGLARVALPSRSSLPSATR